MRKRIAAAMMLAATVLVTDGAISTVKAQDLMPGMIDYTPMINLQAQQMLERNIMQNIMDSQQLGRSGGRLSAAEARAAAARRAEFNRVQSIGAAKIKAGTATTTFVSSVAGTQALIKTLSFDETAPQDPAGQVRFTQRYVKHFNQLATQNGFTINDSADGYAFAYALSYAAYSNRDLDKEQVEQFRRDIKQQLLNHPLYQGSSNIDRQYVYELNAALAAQAAEQRARYRQAETQTEREKYDEKAKFFAKFVLDTKKD